MPHTQAELIERFYQAFAARDAQAMAACYHADVEFTDRAFGTLHGDEARGMWRMLCHNGRDLRITFSDVTADDQAGSARWEAHYTFSATGRPVVNRILAHFEFQGGLIRRHQDEFDMHAWMTQALGFTGRLLGGVGAFQRFFQKKARRTLAAFMARGDGVAASGPARASNVSPSNAG